MCEDLSVGLCAYSVSSSGKRCSLETYESIEGTIEYQCKTSEVLVTNIDIVNLIESDECISACGADRNSVGISSDSLLESTFTSKLCSQECHQKCPNIVDLYYNLALGEGITFHNFKCATWKIAWDAHVLCGKSCKICYVVRVCPLIQLYDSLRFYLCTPKVGGYRFQLSPS